MIFTMEATVLWSQEESFLSFFSVLLLFTLAMVLWVGVIIPKHPIAESRLPGKVMNTTVERGLESSAISSVCMEPLICLQVGLRELCRVFIRS